MIVSRPQSQEMMDFLDGEHIIMRLTYISQYNTHNDSGELENILAQAQHNNEQKGITGALIFNSNYFLQSIEGARPIINELFRKIIKDKRHFSVQVIEAKETDQRRWNKWSMKYLTPSEENRDLALRFSTGSAFNPYLMNSKKLMMLIESLSKIEEAKKNQVVKPNNLISNAKSLKSKFLRQ